MFFAAIVGLILGLRSIEIAMALVVLAAALALKLVVDVKWERMPFFGVVSPYVIYVHNLGRAGEPTRHAWISYGLQLFVFGGLAGGTTYAVVSMFMS
jgi:hypothetical protein